MVDYGTENRAKYKPGALHPVHFGDVYAGRYEIRRKLGYGGFSTVWLAKDRIASKYVALKFLEADISNDNNEVKILERLSRGDLGSKGRRHVLELRDQFESDGPNGRFRCLVFDAMAANAQIIMEAYPLSEETWQWRWRFPLWMSKRIIKQILQGLSYMHSLGITHGDLQPGNILFGARDLTFIDEKLLDQQHVDMPSLMRRDPQKPPDVSKWVAGPETELLGHYMLSKDGTWHDNPHKPKYMAFSQDLSDLADTTSSFEVKISDMGAAYLLENPSKVITTLIGLRSPEMVIDDVPSPNQDVWSYGCLIFEFLTGRPLFPVTYFYKWPGMEPPQTNKNCEPDLENGHNDQKSRSFNNETDEDHLLLLWERLGTIPKSLRDRYPRSSIYFDEEGNNIKSWIGKTAPTQEIERQNMEEFFHAEKPSDMSKEEEETVLKLLRWILQYDPAARPSIEDLVQHPWLQEDT